MDKKDHLFSPVRFFRRWLEILSAFGYLKIVFQLFHWILGVLFNILLMAMTAI